MSNQRNTTYRVTCTVEVDALLAEAAAGMAQVDHFDSGHFSDASELASGSTGHAVDVIRPRVKTYMERLTENTAALRTHGKLVETVAEIAWNVALAHFRPNDSYEFHNLAKDWAAEFEALYDDRIASCEWDEDVWRERCEDFTREKVQETVTAGLGRILSRDEP
jgi:hypothetical protein